MIETNNPESITNISTMAALGYNQRDIAKVTGKSQPTISRRLNTPEYKQIIQNIRDDILNNSASKAAQNIHHAIESYQDTEQHQLKEHGFKASLRVLEGIGILGTPAPQNLLVINQNNVQIHPVIKDILSNQDIDIIDIEPEKD